MIGFIVHGRESHTAHTSSNAMRADIRPDRNAFTRILHGLLNLLLYHYVGEFEHIIQLHSNYPLYFAVY